MPTVESEAKVRTKSRFDEVFQSYATLSEVKKKTKKKRPPKEEHVVLETISRQLEPAQDRVHEVLESSTYNQEEESPRTVRRKARERLWESEDDGAKEHKPAKSEKKKKKKTDVEEKRNTDEPHMDNWDLVQPLNPNNSLEGGLSIRSPITMGTAEEQPSPIHVENEEQLFEAYSLHVSQDETNEIKDHIKKKLRAHLFSHEDQQCLIQNETEKKKRRKKKELVETEPESSVMSLSELQATPVEIYHQPPSEALPQNTFMQEDAPKAKGKTSKRSKTDDIERPNTRGDDVERSRPSNVYDDNLVLGVYIHRSDKLKTDIMVSRPLVKIHVIDQKTGEYVKKETSSDAVSSFHDPERNEYVLPKCTQPYDFKRLKTLIPEWDEQIIFMETFTHLLHIKEDSPNVILFFEILDLVHEDGLKTNSDIEIKEKGFQKIAWAFLKIVGANEVLNIDKKLRLQLYYPPSRARVASSTHVYEWWLKYPRNRYPSTLYVTIRGLKVPDNLNPNCIMASHLEHGILSSDPQSDVAVKENTSADAKRLKEPFRWTRLPGQACRIPNRPCLSLRGGKMGCFSVCFSHVGRTLAAACADKDAYPIYLYEIPSGQYLRELQGHLNVVYDLCWSTDDQHLLSASSDGTVRLWRITNEDSSALKVLPHPSFVYTAKFHPMSDCLAVTGCYDAVIRVWNVKVKEVNGHLLQEFDGHKSFINSLCFDAEGLHMFSGDSSGLIIMWNTNIRSFQQNPLELWGILKEIKEADLKGIAVNHLQVHPNGRRLLIHTKDSTVRIMDLRILAAKKYIGATNYREKLCSAFTPCGTFVIAGSEDGVAYVWNSETGDQVAKYTDLSYTAPLRDVAFHPHEHMVAFCAFGPSQPIIVYIYDYKVAQLEAETVQATGDANGQSSSDVLTFQDAVIAAKSSMRMMKVKQKLDSVLSGSNGFLPAPSLLSPHSKIRLTGTPNTQLQTLGTNTHGGFSPVGQSLSRQPSIKLQMSNSESKVSSLKIEADGILPVQETVVALYDYTAHRSDELSIHRSDIIHVLYKDNDNWWFGNLLNGQQGYFPANYVAAEIQHEYDNLATSESHYPASHSQADDRDHTHDMMSAIPRKSKDLKFMSHHDTDVGSPVTPEKKKKMHQMRQSPDFTSQPVDLQDSSVKSKKKKSLKQISVGKTNLAFQPDE